ncbi:DUF4303 domain-containing protein [Paracoccus kondratievae]
MQSAGELPRSLEQKAGIAALVQGLVAPTLEMQTDCIRQPICTNQPTVEKCSQLNGTIKTDDRYRAKGSACGADLLRWSEAGSPYHLYGDEHFRDVEALFLLGGDHRALPEPAYKAEVAARFQAMEDALHDLDREGFFGDGPERFAVVINVVAPGRKTKMSSRRAPPVSIPRKAWCNYGMISAREYAIMTEY